MSKNTRTSEAIAIIGLGCRLPGAPDIPSYWRLLRDGVDAVTEVPADRWDRDAISDPRPAIPGKTVSRHGGFVDDIERFDAWFFDISPRHAVRTDPQQRMLLEAAWEALERAGLRREELAGTRGGVFLGLCTDDYITLERSDPRNIDIYTGMGGNRGAAAGRLAYFLEWRGPACAIDTACSSSLVAVHLACQALRKGECEIAMAGGANAILHPITAVAFSQAGMLSPDGRCKPFSALANGFVRSEGAGVVILKSLRRALADGDPIVAVIRGTAMNNDGASSPMMQPSRTGQEAVLKAAYADAGVSPAHVQYVEAHGTGTIVGDPIEMAALHAVLGPGRSRRPACLVGSSKSNLGHLEAAAGIAGLLKAVLCLQHREIPPTLHCADLNPAIPWEQIPFRVQRVLGPWPATRGRPALAGVNSFGITGTNVHVVLEEAPPAPAPPPAADRADTRLLALSAQTPSALEETARRYRNWLASETSETSGAPETLHAICYSADARRTHHDHRLAVVARTREEAVEQLDAFLGDENREGTISGQRMPRRAPVFVFSGVGTQWIGMGMRLLESEPVFRSVFEQCDRVFRDLAGWSVREAIEAPEGVSRLEEVEVMQPAIFSVQVALAALWRSWGIEPGAVVGHSLGEFAAAHVAGALTLEEAALAVRHRSRLMQSVQGKGRMLAVGLDLQAARAAVRGMEGRVDVAVFNSPTSCVLAGEPEALETIHARLQGQEVFSRFLRAGVAFHSPQVTPFVDRLMDALRDLRPRDGQVPLYSTVTGDRIEGTTIDAAYCARNMRQPVLFAPTVAKLVRDGYDTFLEVSPHPVLLTPIREGAPAEVTVLASLCRDQDEPQALLSTLGALYCAGHPVSWEGLFPQGGRFVPPPCYPWQRERFWFSESRPMFRGFFADRQDAAAASSHPFFTTRWESAQQPGVHFFEAAIDTTRFPYLADHCLQGTPLLPAAAYIDMALAASLEAYGPGPRTLCRMKLHRPLFLSAETRRLQLVLTPDLPGTATFRFYHRHDAGWQLQVEGEVHLREVAFELPFDTDGSPQELVRSLPRVENGVADLYERAWNRGLEYGPHFRGVQEVWREGDDAVVIVQSAEEVALGSGGYQVHPALMDCLLHAYAAIPYGSKHAALPVSVEALQFRRMPRPGERLWCRVRTRLLEDGRDGSMAIYDEEGGLVAKELRHRGRFFTRDAQPQDEQDAWLYEVAWEERALAPSPTRSEMRGRWLVIADEDAGSIRHARALSERLSARGASVAVKRPQATRLDMVDMLRGFRDEEEAAPWQGVLHMVALGAPDNDGLEADGLLQVEERICGSLLHLVQALADLDVAPRLWAVTRGAQALDGERPSLAQSCLLGLARVAASEHPKLGVTRIDLDPRDPDLSMDGLLGAIASGDDEPEIALRGGKRLVARLGRLDPVAVTLQRPLAAEESYRLETRGDGILDHLALRPVERRTPGPGEVEIEVVTVGMNFLDVLQALNSLPGRPPGASSFGMECAGRITAVGEGVDGFAPGDAVVAINAGGSGCFVRFLTIEARKVFKKPPHLSFAETTTIPVAYQTAWYALHHQGRMRAGESVLVHCGAGGVGLAAVEIALQAGAVVYATAGTPEKRAYLESLGVRHCMSSRTLAFADEIMDVTGGRGVDLVLNSLAGEAIPRSLGILATGGRFLEIGKRDIYGDSRIGLLPFQRNLSFYAIDLFRLALERPDVLEAVTAEVVERMHDGFFKPLPHRCFPVSQVAEAFRTMAQGKHTGKLVISLEDDAARLEAPVCPPIRAEATYLVTGGLGALGLAFARRLISQGARHLALLGRRPPTPEVEEVLTALRADGASVSTFAVDVSRPVDVARVLDEIRATSPPVRGVLHAAGTLSDGILQRLDWNRFEAVMAPKVQGAWNLHQALESQPLDFFVLFSSAATTFGASGQGNYAAANAFLDALARHRRASGKPGLSVSWGPWAEVGMAARPERGGRLAAEGQGSIPPEQGTALLQRLLGCDAVHVTVAPVDWERWKEAHPAIVRAPFLSRLVAPGGEEAGDGTTRCPADPRALEAFLVDVLGRVLKIAADRLDCSTTLNRLGLDSLMAVELKNRIEKELGVTVPVVRLLDGPSISALAAWLHGQMKGSTAEGEAGGAVASPRAGSAGSDGSRTETAGADDAAPARMTDPVLERRPDLPAAVSYGQQRMWLLDQLWPGNPCYNMSTAVRLEGVPDCEALERALTEIVRRHEVLRTGLVVRDDEIVGVVEAPAPVPLPVVSLEHLPALEREPEARRRAAEEGRRPFDLTRSPLLRALLLRLSDEEHVLVTTVHHVAYDGRSIGILARELSLLYAGVPLPELPVQYSDYARWQQACLQGERFDESLAYWRHHLSDAPVLGLRTPLPRPPAPSHRGGLVLAHLPPETLQALKGLGQERHATLFMVLLAAFQAALARASGQDDIVVGCPISNRQHADLEGLLGFFANTLVMRGDCSGNPTFVGVLERTRQTCMEAYAHQDVPFERLVEELKLRRDPARNPLFQVAMALAQEPSELPGMSGLRAIPFPFHNGTTKFDLFLEFTEGPRGLACALEYSADLYDDASAAGLLSEVTGLLEDVVRDPVRPVRPMTSTAVGS